MFQAVERLLAVAPSDPNQEAIPMTSPHSVASAEHGLPPVSPRSSAIEVGPIAHIGIRVVEEARAVEFYGWLGFRIVERVDVGFPLVVLSNSTGVELHLVITATPGFDGRNVLADLPTRPPGFNHLALRVESVDNAADRLRQLGVRITEGPGRIGPSRALLLRDPDANVIELREEIDWNDPENVEVYGKRDVER